MENLYISLQHDALNQDIHGSIVAAVTIQDHWAGKTMLYQAGQNIMQIQFECLGVNRNGSWEIQKGSQIPKPDDRQDDDLACMAARKPIS